MHKDQVRFADLQRILFGEAPAEFLIETLLRSVIVFIALTVIMRMLGKRMSGQLTISEMAIMLLLGAAVGAGFQMPDRGILAAIAILLLILICHRLLTTWSLSNVQVSKLAEGDAKVLVIDGMIHLDDMLRANVSREQLFSILRSKMIYTLGTVRRVYLEGCGSFSIYTTGNPSPGLSTLPEEEKALKGVVQQTNQSICSRCGNTAIEENKPCGRCGNNTRAIAVL